jgi:hypothetical protein
MRRGEISIASNADNGMKCAKGENLRSPPDSLLSTGEGIQAAIKDNRAGIPQELAFNMKRITNVLGATKLTEALHQPD